MYHSDPREPAYGVPGLYVLPQSGSVIRDAAGRDVAGGGRLDQKAARRVIIHTDQLDRAADGTYRAMIRPAHGVVGIGLAYAYVPRSLTPGCLAQLILHSIPIKPGGSASDRLYQRMVRNQLLSNDVSEYPFFPPASSDDALSIHNGLGFDWQSTSAGANGHWTMSDGMTTHIPRGRETRYSNAMVDVDIVSVYVPHEASIAEVGNALASALVQHTGSVGDRKNSLWKYFGIGVTPSGFSVHMDATAYSTLNTFAVVVRADDVARHAGSAGVSAYTEYLSPNGAGGDTILPMFGQIVIVLDVAREVYVDESNVSGSASTMTYGMSGSHAALRTYKPVQSAGEDSAAFTGLYTITIPPNDAVGVIHALSFPSSVTLSNIKSVRSTRSVPLRTTGATPQGASLISVVGVSGWDATEIQGGDRFVINDHMATPYVINSVVPASSLPAWVDQSTFVIRDASPAINGSDPISLFDGNDLTRYDVASVLETDVAFVSVDATTDITINKFETRGRSFGYPLKIRLFVGTADPAGPFILLAEQSLALPPFENTRVTFKFGVVTVRYFKIEFAGVLEPEMRLSTLDFGYDAVPGEVVLSVSPGAPALASNASAFGVRSGSEQYVNLSPIQKSFDPVRDVSLGMRWEGRTMGRDFDIRGNRMFESRSSAMLTYNGDAPTPHIANSLNTSTELVNTAVPPSATTDGLLPLSNINDAHQSDRMLFCGHMMNVSAPRPMRSSALAGDSAGFAEVYANDSLIPHERYVLPATESGHAPGDGPSHRFFSSGLGYATSVMCGTRTRYVMPAFPKRTTQVLQPPDNPGDDPIEVSSFILDSAPQSDTFCTTSVSPLVARILNMSRGSNGLPQSFYEAVGEDGTVLSMDAGDARNYVGSVGTTSPVQVPHYYRARTIDGVSNAIVVTIGSGKYTVVRAWRVSVLTNDCPWSLSMEAAVGGSLLSAKDDMAALEFYTLVNGRFQCDVNAKYWTWCFELDRDVLLDTAIAAGAPKWSGDMRDESVAEEAVRTTASNDSVNTRRNRGGTIMRVPIVPSGARRVFDGLAHAAAMMCPSSFMGSSGRPSQWSLQPAPPSFFVTAPTGHSLTSVPLLRLHDVGNTEYPTNARVSAGSGGAFALLSAEKNEDPATPCCANSTTWFRSTRSMSEIKFSLATRDGGEYNLRSNATIVLDLYAEND